MAKITNETNAAEVAATKIATKRALVEEAGMKATAEENTTTPKERAAAKKTTHEKATDAKAEGPGATKTVDEAIGPRAMGAQGPGPQDNFEEEQEETGTKAEEPGAAKIANETRAEEKPPGPETTARKEVKGEAPTEELLQEALDQPINKTAWEVPGEERSTPLPAQSNKELIEDYDATATTEPGTAGLGAEGYKAEKEVTKEPREQPQHEAVGPPDELTMTGDHPPRPQ